MRSIAEIISIKSVVFNLFDLLQGLFIVLFGYNGFHYSSIAGFIKVKVKVNPKFMRIAVISENF